MRRRAAMQLKLRMSRGTTALAAGLLILAAADAADARGGKGAPIAGPAKPTFQTCAGKACGLPGGKNAPPTLPTCTGKGCGLPIGPAAPPPPGPFRYPGGGGHH